MSCKDNKHHRKKQRDLEILLPQISLLTDSSTLNFQFSTFNFQFLKKLLAAFIMSRFSLRSAPLVLNSLMPLGSFA